jgi:diguanylate cyclase (GGDEF)-like protein
LPLGIATTRTTTPTFESGLHTTLLRLARQPAVAPVADLEPYEADVTRALQNGFPWMYFPARLEELFEYETRHERSRHLVGVGILWIGLSALYSILSLNGLATPLAFGTEAAIRTALLTPIIIAITFAIWWGVRPAVRESLMMFANVLAPATIILLVTFSRNSDVGASRGALTLVLLFITVVVRLRFWYALSACLAILAVQVVVPSIMNVPLPGNVGLVIVTIAATLTANYTLEREYRVNYLQRVHGRLQGARLSAMVKQLHDLAQHDSLTGLANRRAMDAQLEELFARGERFAVILVDIDAFKAFNDAYGHQIGDDCLRRVAAMLRASMRFTTDRIARMGGEEFAVVLPRTSLDDARLMAERMRKSVLELRIPHLGSPTGDVVSISLGVSASVAPTAPGELIRTADKALYRAKALGRNRVEVSGLGHSGAVPVLQGLRTA